MTDIIFGITPIDNVVSATEDKELSGDWSISFRCVFDTAPAIEEGDEVTVDGQPFFVDRKEEIRDGEQRFLDIGATHRFFQLENSVVYEEYEFEGSVLDHVEELLTHQAGTSFTAAVDPGITGADLTAYLSVGGILEINPGDLFASLQMILKNFLSHYRIDGDNIYLMPENYVRTSDIRFEYGLNNINVNRRYDMSNITKKLYARAWLRGTPGDPIIVKEYGISETPERFVDFGNLTTEASLDEIAARYLAIRQTPDAEYSLSVVDLLRLPLGEQPIGVHSDEIDVGLGVDVEDTDLGIDETLVVQRFARSLVEDHLPMTLTVGMIRQEHIVEMVQRIVSLTDQRQERGPRLYTSTDPEHDPDPEKGKDGDVFVRPVL